MKIQDIQFKDPQFEAVVKATGFENAEEIIELRARKSSISNVDELKYFTELKLLDLTRNQIQEIDLSQNTKLEELYLGNNELEALDLSNNALINHLEIFINDIEYLDISHLKNLENLYANKNELSEIDLTGNLAIESIQLSNNRELTCLQLPVNCLPLVVKLENTKVNAQVQSYLREVVPAHNLHL